MIAVIYAPDTVDPRGPKGKSEVGETFRLADAPERFALTRCLCAPKA